MAQREERAAHAGVRVRVTTRARMDEIAGTHDGAIVVRVTAPPQDGRANEAVRRLLAERLRVAVTSVQVIRGERNRDKLVGVDGMSAAEVERALLRG
jgi:uncharacterized protein (TIGR00251 family)